LLVAIAALFTAFGLEPPGDPRPFIGLAWYATFTQNFWMVLNSSWNLWLAQTWSLAVEEQFYLILPLLIAIVPTRFLVAVIGVLVALAFVARCLFVVLLPGSGIEASHTLLVSRMDALLLGVFVAHALATYSIGQRVRFRLTVAFLLLGATLAGIMVLGAGAPARIVATPLMQTAGLSLTALFYAVALVLIVLQKDGIVLAILTWPPLRRLGIWAYCIFLVHMMIPTMIFQAAGRPFAVSSATDVAILAVSFAAVLAVAHVSWTRFESPLLEAGRKRWSYKKPGEGLTPVLSDQGVVAR
jgi:peptidoglycan/LPS O-acetylase OafA/YrhL